MIETQIHPPEEVLKKEMQKFARKLVGLTPEKARERCAESGVSILIVLENDKAVDHPKKTTGDVVKVEVKDGKVVKAAPWNSN